MRQDTIAYPDEAPPAYSANADGPQSTRPKSTSWSKNRVWILTLISLVLFGIIFGAVYGVKKSRSEDSETIRDRLLANQGLTSSSWAYYPTSSRLYDGGYPLPSSYSDSPTSSYIDGATSSSFPYPTPGPTEPSDPSEPSGPTEPSGPILQAQGQVSRDISAAHGVPELLVWDLREGGTLWKKEVNRVFEAYRYRQFLFAPVAVRTSDTTQTAVSVDAVSGRMVYMHFHDGHWDDDWQELEFAAQFLRRPAVISRAENRVDVINVDNEGHIWIVSYDGSAWSEWTELGTDITSEVSATTWGEDRIDVFAKSGETFFHKHWTSESGWPGDWEDLGQPFLGYYSEPNVYTSSPLAVSWRDGDDGVIDVYVTKPQQGSDHKLFKEGVWSDWLTVPASHEGYEFSDTQSVVNGRGVDGHPFAHLISRGTDDCIHYIDHNGTAWNSWSFLWCNREDSLTYPTQFLSTSMAAQQNGNLDVAVKDILGNVLRLQVIIPIDPLASWSNDNWDNFGKPTT